MLSLSRIVIGIVIVSAIGYAGPASASGHSVGNGGGVSEQNLTYAWPRFEQFLLPCIQSELCGLDPSEKEAAKTILDSLDLERAASPLVFLSGSKNPGLFEDPGTQLPRPLNEMMVTRPRLREPIYVNLDTLYTPDPAGAPRALSIAQAVGALAESWASHHEEIAEGVRASIGSKLTLAHQRSAARIHLGGLGQPELAALLVDSLENGATDVWLTDAQAMYPMSVEILSRAPCPQGALAHARDLRIPSLGWTRDGDQVRYSGRVEYVCGAIWMRGQVLLRSELKPGVKWLLVPESLAILFQNVESGY
jgi:hypothetical protein